MLTARSPAATRPRADSFDPATAHEEDERAARGSEALVLRLAVVRGVAAGERDAVGDAAMGERDARRRGHRRGRRDARHDLDTETGALQRERLLAAAAEDERVASLQPDDVRPRSSRARRAER